MRTNSKKNVDIDWKVIAVAEMEDRDKPELVIQYHSLGFEKYGFGGEIYVYDKVCNARKVMRLINLVGEFFIRGDELAEDNRHIVDKKNGEPKFIFDIGRGKNEFGDDCIFVKPIYYDPAVD